MASVATNPSVLVVGATGKQGGALIKALLASDDTKSLTILALTRDALSARAQALAASSEGTDHQPIQLVQGDPLKPEAIFEGLPRGSVTSLFLVTVPPKEETQAIPFIDAAIAHGVRHIVFSSVERGGDARSWDNPTDVTHFYEKHNVEVYLRDTAKAIANDSGKTPVTWTILRPVAFMDNLNPGMFCGVFVSMWSIALQPTRKLQLVATTDIGLWAAQSIAAATASSSPLPSSSPYANRAIGLAGDDLTLTEARAIFQRVTGQPTPWAWWIFGKLVLWLVGDLGKMFAFFDREGYGVDIAALRAGEGPGTKSLETWLRTESGWKKKE